MSTKTFIGYAGSKKNITLLGIFFLINIALSIGNDARAQIATFAGYNDARAQTAMFAGYDEFCGIRVIVTPTSQNAVATYDQFGPVINVDPGVMGNWSFSRIFVLSHECGHHALGHLSLVEQKHFNATPRQEQQADCWAARTLASNGYFDAIEKTIRQSYSFGPYVQDSYPSVVERTQHIAKCAKIEIEGTEGEPEDYEPDFRECLENMHESCMVLCIYDYGYSPNVCMNKMCNSPRQKTSYQKRCRKELD